MAETTTATTTTTGAGAGAVASSGLFDYEITTPRSSLLTCSFNQDGGCLAVGTTTGFSVHNLYPQYAVSVAHDPLIVNSSSGGTAGTPGGPKQPQQQQQPPSSTTPSSITAATTTTTNITTSCGGGIGQIELLFRCNIMLLVGGGPNPYTPPHRVLIWDDHLIKPIGELSFRQRVVAVKLRKDSIVVALQDRCYIYDLATLTLKDKIYTADNPHGLLSVSTQINDMVVACPAVTIGHVRVELYALRKTVLLEAHESALRGLVLTADGTKLATASEKGTVLRIFDIMSASCIQEFRRGFERATITCLAWSWDMLYLACTSDKGTCHIFQVTSSNPDSADTNNNNNNNNSNRQKSSSKSSSANETAASLTRLIFSSVRKSVEGDASKKSICQIRGIPHPQACAFIGEAASIPESISASESGPVGSTTTQPPPVTTIQVAVAGWDADGNGALLITECKIPHTTTSTSSSSSSHITEEPKRIGYHILCRTEPELTKETDEARRRRRLAGRAPDIPATPEGGRLYIGERIEMMDGLMDQINFEENEDDDEFVSVVTTTTAQQQTTPHISNSRKQQSSSTSKSSSSIRPPTAPTSSPKNTTTAATNNGTENNNFATTTTDSGTINSDSLQTEPLEDDDDDDDRNVDADDGEFL